MARSDAWSLDPTLEPRLRLLVATGDTASEIGRKLKLSRNAVIGKCVRLGLTLRCAKTRRFKVERKQDAPRVDSGYQTPSPPRRFSFEEPSHVS